MTKTMTKTGAWSQDELQRIAETDDLHMASFREDGSTYGTPTWIWSVVVGDELYVACLQRHELTLVSGRAETEGGSHHGGRDDERGCLRAGARRRHERPDRCGISGEVRHERVSRPDDWPARPRRDSPGHAARRRHLKG